MDNPPCLHELFRLGHKESYFPEFQHVPPALDQIAIEIIDYLELFNRDLGYCEGTSDLLFATIQGNKKDVTWLLSEDVDKTSVNDPNKEGVSPLTAAAFNGDCELINTFWEAGAKINAQDSHGRTALMAASQEGKEDAIHLLLKLGARFNMESKTGKTAIFYAAMREHENIVDILAKKSDSGLIHQKDLNGNTVLSLCALHNRKEMVKQLIRLDAEIDSVDKKGRTPLMCAVQENNMDIAKILIQTGANVHSKTENGIATLNYAIGSNQVDIVEFILTKTTNINQADRNGYTPLMHGATKGNLEIFKLLLHSIWLSENCRNFDINGMNCNGITLLMCAIEGGNFNIIDLLLGYGANINICDEKGETLLFTSAQNGKENTVKLLISLGAALDKPNSKLLTPLMAATSKGFVAIVSDLIEMGADPTITCSSCKSILDYTDNDTLRSLLHNRIKNCSVTTMLFLDSCYEENMKLANHLDKDYNVNTRSKSKNGVDLLKAAIKCGNVLYTKKILAKGANINSSTNDGKTSLMYATEGGHDEIVNLLLQSSTPITVMLNTREETKGYCALNYAIQNGSMSIVKVLLEKGAMVDNIDNAGQTPLVQAICLCHTAIVQLLIGFNANVNKKDSKNKTPLMSAVKKDLDIVKLLIQNGADVSIKSQTGKTAQYYAHKNKREDVVNYLDEKIRCKSKDSQMMKQENEPGVLPYDRTEYKFSHDGTSNKNTEQVEEEKKEDEVIDEDDDETVNVMQEMELEDASHKHHESHTSPCEIPAVTDIQKSLVSIDLQWSKKVTLVKEQSTYPNEGHKEDGQDDTIVKRVYTIPSVGHQEDGADETVVKGVYTTSSGGQEDGTDEAMINPISQVQSLQSTGRPDTLLDEVEEIQATGHSSGADTFSANWMADLIRRKDTTKGQQIQMKQRQEKEDRSQPSLTFTLNCMKFPKVEKVGTHVFGKNKQIRAVLKFCGSYTDDHLIQTRARFGELRSSFMKEYDIILNCEIEEDERLEQTENRHWIQYELEGDPALLDYFKSYILQVEKVFCETANIDYITEGSIKFHVRVHDLNHLHVLLEEYENGNILRRMEEFVVSSEIPNREEVTGLVMTVDENEISKLKEYFEENEKFTKGKLTFPVSYTYCKWTCEWYWSADKIVWFSVSARCVSMGDYEGSEVLESDILIMEFLMGNNSLLPNPVPETCSICCQADDIKTHVNQEVEFGFENLKDQSFFRHLVHQKTELEHLRNHHHQSYSREQELEKYKADVASVKYVLEMLTKTTNFHEKPDKVENNSSNERSTYENFENGSDRDYALKELQKDTMAGCVSNLQNSSTVIDHIDHQSLGKQQPSQHFVSVMDHSIGNNNPYDDNIEEGIQKETVSDIYVIKNKTATLFEKNMVRSLTEQQNPHESISQMKEDIKNRSQLPMTNDTTSSLKALQKGIMAGVVSNLHNTSAEIEQMEHNSLGKQQLSQHFGSKIDHSIGNNNPYDENIEKEIQKETVSAILSEKNMSILLVEQQNPHQSAIDKKEDNNNQSEKNMLSSNSSDESGYNTDSSHSNTKRVSPSEDVDESSHSNGPRYLSSDSTDSSHSNIQTVSPSNDVDTSSHSNDPRDLSSNSTDSSHSNTQRVSPSDDVDESSHSNSPRDISSDSSGSSGLTRRYTQFQTEVDESSHPTSTRGPSSDSSGSSGLTRRYTQFQREVRSFEPPSWSELSADMVILPESGQGFFDDTVEDVKTISPLDLVGKAEVILEFTRFLFTGNLLDVEEGYGISKLFQYTDLPQYASLQINEDKNIGPRDSRSNKTLEFAKSRWQSKFKMHMGVQRLLRDVVIVKTLLTATVYSDISTKQLLGYLRKFKSDNNYPVEFDLKYPEETSKKSIQNGCCSDNNRQIMTKSIMENGCPENDDALNNALQNSRRYQGISKGTDSLPNKTLSTRGKYISLDMRSKLDKETYNQADFIRLWEKILDLIIIEVELLANVLD